MGSSASEEQIRRLAGFSRVTLCLDPDDAGRVGSTAILSALSRLTHVRIIECTRQPDELSPEQIQDIVEV